MLLRDDLLPWARARIATNPSWPRDKVDEILTWVTLGGAGPGDPTFDPATCLVNPVDASQPLSEFVVRQTPTLQSVLWPVRMAVIGRASTVSIDVLAEAARDPVPAIRRRTAEFASFHLVRELCDDRDPQVRSTARRMRPSVPRPPLLRRSPRS